MQRPIQQCVHGRESGRNDAAGDERDGSAYADPYVYIDPVFASAHPEYSFIFSEGVGNTLAQAAAPEPTTFSAIALSGACLFLFGRVMRSRRP